MMTKSNCLILFCVCAWIAQVNCRATAGPAFTYQGQLMAGSGSANGHYDLLFNLCTALNAGNTNATFTNLNVAVINGIFTTPVDFGSVFDGTDYWIEIAVRTNGSVGA